MYYKKREVSSIISGREDEKNIGPGFLNRPLPHFSFGQSGEC
jgi:hypothetical protein